MDDKCYVFHAEEILHCPSMLYKFQYIWKNIISLKFTINEFLPQSMLYFISFLSLYKRLKKNTHSIISRACPMVHFNNINQSNNIHVNYSLVRQTFRETEFLNNFNYVVNCFYKYTQNRKSWLNSKAYKWIQMITIEMIMNNITNLKPILKVKQKWQNARFIVKKINKYELSFMQDKC